MRTLHVEARTRALTAIATTVVLALASATTSFSLDRAAAQPVATGRGLWVGGEKYISEFQGKALKRGGAARASLAFGSTNFFATLSMVFDHHNDLWIAFAGVNVGNAPVIEVSRADVAKLKTGKPVKAPVILRNPGTGSDPFIIPRSLAFDAAGDLWVSDGGRRGIMEFLPVQIAQSGAPAPSVLITAPDFVPTVIRFDASNNLWVARFQAPFTPLQVWRFAPGDRSATGPPAPGLVIDLSDMLDPQDLAFDNSGNLWIAGNNSQGDVIEMFSAGDLGGSGEISPSPAVSVTSSAFGSVQAGSCLGGMDFDGSGNLWLSVMPDNGDCNANQQLVEFTPGQLSAGGNLSPSLAIVQNTKRTNLFLPGPIRFGPTL